jgi:hypothetical protein
MLSKWILERSKTRTPNPIAQTGITCQIEFRLIHHIDTKSRRMAPPSITEPGKNGLAALILQASIY